MLWHYFRRWCGPRQRFGAGLRLPVGDRAAGRSSFLTEESLPPRLG
jgi:hypothetical protein